MTRGFNQVSVFGLSFVLATRCVTSCSHFISGFVRETVDSQFLVFFVLHITNSIIHCVYFKYNEYINNNSLTLTVRGSTLVVRI